jgi:outer membrane protein assembly factor BamB
MIGMASFRAIVCCAGMALTSQEANTYSRWPQFRGPNAMGIAADGIKLPTDFGPAKNVVWKTSFPLGHSSPCIWDDRIFLTSFDPAAKKLDTLCLDRRNGQILWRRTAPAKQIEKGHRFNNPAVATPATDGERVYVYFGSFGLLCYDVEGKELWKKALPQVKTTFGTATSPVVAGELLLLNCEFQPDPCLMALQARTGETRWKQARTLTSTGGPVDGYGTPVVWQHDGVNEVVLHGRMRLTAYDLKDGTERWSVAATSAASSTPVLGDGQLYHAAHGFGTVEGEVLEPPSFDAMLKKYDKNQDGQISAAEFPTDLYLFRRLDVSGTDLPLRFLFRMIDVNRDGQVSREEWDKFLEQRREMMSLQLVGLLAVKPGGRGDITKTHVSWREQRAISEVASPLYYRGRIYMVRDGGLVSCLDAKTGRLVYRERLGAAGPYFSSPVAGDGKIYAASQRGVVVVFAAGDKFKVLARNDLGETIQATPALVDGKIYVRTENHLFAFGAPPAPATVP